MVALPALPEIEDTKTDLILRRLDRMERKQDRLAGILIWSLSIMLGVLAFGAFYAMGIKEWSERMEWLHVTVCGALAFVVARGLYQFMDTTYWTGSGSFTGKVKGYDQN